MLKKYLTNKKNSIKKQIEDNLYAIKMYGCDAWGTDAFSNIEKMEKLEEENKKLAKHYKFYDTIYNIWGYNKKGSK